MVLINNKEKHWRSYERTILMLSDMVFLKWMYRWNKIKHFTDPVEVWFFFFPGKGPDEGPQKPGLKAVAKYVIWIVGRDKWWPSAHSWKCFLFYLAISYPTVFKRHLHLGSGQSQRSNASSGSTIPGLSSCHENRVSPATLPMEL